MIINQWGIRILNALPLYSSIYVFVLYFHRTFAAEQSLSLIFWPEQKKQNFTITKQTEVLGAEVWRVAYYAYAHLSF